MRFFQPLLFTALLLNALSPPRNHGSHFEKHKITAQEGAADDDAEMDELGVHHVDTAGAMRRMGFGRPGQEQCGKSVGETFLPIRR